MRYLSLTGQLNGYQRLLSTSHQEFTMKTVTLCLNVHTLHKRTLHFHVFQCAVIHMQACGSGSLCLTNLLDIPYGQTHTHSSKWSLRGLSLHPGRERFFVLCRFAAYEAVRYRRVAILDISHFLRWKS